MTDEGDREGRIDCLARCLDDRRQQNEESPEDEGVHRARHEALEQLPLPEHHYALPLQTNREILRPSNGTPEQDEAGDAPRPPHEEHPGEADDCDEHGGADEHGPSLCAGPSGGAPGSIGRGVLRSCGGHEPGPGTARGIFVTEADASGLVKNLSP
jgi:hypothetical protein